MIRKACLTVALLAFATAPAITLAQDDSAGDNQSSGGGNSGAVTLNKILQVLQQDPPSASDACVDALKELHKTQDIVAADEAHSKDQDLVIARDVLESDYEEANQVCGTDARTLCRVKNDKLPNLPAACATIHANPN